MPNSILNTSFHDNKIIDIKKEKNDVIIIANDYKNIKYTFLIKNAKIVSDVDINLDDIKDAVIISLSYHELKDKENYIHLETISKAIPFNDEIYFYSNDITISRKK